jgi:ribosomal protein L7/L12
VGRGVWHAARVLLALIGGAVVVVVVIVVLARQRGAEVVEVGRPVQPKRTVGGGLAGVQDPLREGQKIEAIKRHRQATGGGLTEAKDAVEAMEAQPGAAPPHPALEDPAHDAELRRLLQRSELIPAIKRYRELTGLGLKEAKEAVEALSLQPLAPVAAATRQDPAMDPEVRRLVQGGELIAAIARYRELSGLSLKESKDAVDALRDSMPG